ncbi:LysE family translocator [Kushneria aurantia]|uniref:LysE family translocator n=1 Tax=Kushneria aurantia TaxID=504092 RepID=A0ABV6G081_9GAMM|nr:LysE family translocator [Kushneria aurantia]
MPTLILSMSLFALAASLSPGPVNLVALHSGLHFGLRRALRHVTGATLGFTLLLVLIGSGMEGLSAIVPRLTELLRWVGMGYLLWMAWGLSRSDGPGHERAAPLPPSFWRGALMQWLNPKAWIASAAGVSVYTADGGAALTVLFIVLFFVICYASLASWALLGARLGRRVMEQRRLQWLNRLMAAGLVIAALSITLI